MGRVRRTTTKSVNYSKEQAFSDDDVFEDGHNDDDADELSVKARRKSRGANKKSNSNVSSSAYDTSSVFPTDVVTTSNSGYEVPDKMRHFEKGYDVSLGHIRERFDFMAELELDGSPKVELIVGRRLISDGENNDDDATSTPTSDNDNGSDDDMEDKRTRKQRGNKKTTTSPKKKKKKKDKDEPAKHHAEYEYLIKYKGKSYLHLEWKAASELESMNKSAKNLYRRFLKKVKNGADDDIEDPDVDSSFIQPQRIVDEDEHEVTVELTDKELIEWEKQQALEMEEEESSDEEEKGKEKTKKNGLESAPKTDGDDNAKSEGSEDTPIEEIEIGEPGTLSKEDIVRILNSQGPYYPSVTGTDNPYRDGYVTEPPKKPRASYLFFQGVYRSVFQKKNKGASVGEVMKLLGDTWGAMSDEEQEPFIELAREEVVEYEKQRVLLEKAQRPTELWQPLRRCLMIVDRLSSDGFADIFLEPVNLDDFPDYTEYVESPIDLGTIRKKIKNRKYMGPEQYARDMRKIWSNCKIYNQHGSAIWYVADYMSKQFERLYHAWVIEFRDKYLRWANPKARPWEQSCRECDGKCEAKDDVMVLCDHCDSVHNISCLKPPLKKVPEGVWHCVDCARKIKRDPSARMLSAVSEHAARKRAELGDIPTKKEFVKMYLVKWAGLGYEHCTWETKEDIKDDALINLFYTENNMTPDEPDLTTNDIIESMKAVKHLNKENAGGVKNIPDLRSQLYSQARAFQFVKFGMPPPPKLCDECGPQTKDCYSLEDNPRSDGVDAAVETRLKHLPPLLVGEYDAVVPMTSHGLLMNVGEVNGSVAFLGYRQFPDKTKGPSEIKNIIRSSGDKIIAVDGVSTVGKSFKDVIFLLKGNGKNECVFIRFLSSKYSNVNGELSSMGRIGRLMATEAEKQFRRDRRQLLIKRKLDLEGHDESLEEVEEESDGSVRESESDSEDEEASVVSYEQNSDDEDLVKKQKVQNLLSSVEAPKDGGHSNETKKNPQSDPNEKTAGILPNADEGKDGGKNDASKSDEKVNASSDVQEKISHQETTQSLALRLLDINVGYSSDEGGDEDRVYFLDGVDETFCTREDALNGVANESQCDEYDLSAPIPAKRSEFDDLGDRAKICSAMLLTNHAPDAEDFDNYPLPSLKEMELIAKAAEEEAKEKAKNEELTNSSTLPVKLSQSKIEQVSIASNEAIRVWKSAEDAAATLQISLKDIKQVLSGVYNEDLGDEVGGYRWRFAAEDAEVTKIAAVIKDNDKGKKAFLEFRDKLYDHEKPHHYKNGNRLRDYQIDGVNWLASCWYKANGCILADEMGLGKTVQIVCYIEHLNRVEKIQRPFLVVVPLSTVEHWRREFEGWTQLKTCIYHDRQRVWRDVMREYEWYYADRPHTPDFLKFDVLVTTYDTLIGDFDVIGQIPWRVTVVDEAHRLRNQKGKLLECMKELSAKGTLQHGYQSRVLMTGTPLQNNIQELWTLLNFIEPYKFPSLEEFDEHYGNMRNKDQVERLQNKISPFMLRRVKEDVAKDIPAKEETLIDVELTSIQKQFYRAIFEHNHSFLNMGNTRNVAPKLMNIQMELRKCCNHPFLLDGVEHRETEKQQKEMLESGEFDGKSPEEIQTMLNVKGYIDTSGKMVLLDKLLPKLRQEGHKVLIFSQMVKMLDLLAEYCDFRDFRYERLDGRVRGNERQKAIDRFETEEDSFIFMLSTRAGGVGINLTAADICIIFDSDWNPQNDVQAQARCHRIGQTKSVMIYRLITSRTFEQEMFDRASKKLGLEQAVLGTFDKGDDGKPSAKEMEQLLKQGAYALLEDDADAQSFVTDDIESILKKRTRTRVVEGTKTANWLNKQGMVTKSKFTSDSKSAALDMDDPNFWEKVMPDFVTPAIMRTKLDELMKQTSDTGGKKKGRGRGRRKKNAVLDEGPEKEEKDGQENMGGADISEVVDDNPNSDKKDNTALSRTNLKKINKYIQDLKSMMDGVFEDIDDDNLPEEDKASCEQLLLSISVKAKVFSDAQRNLAKSLLKRLEGDRRRKCRDTGDEPGRFSKATRFTSDPASPTVNESLLIRSSKKRKKKRGRSSLDDDEPSGKKGRNGYGTSATTDGDIERSDSDGDLSDIEDNAYESGASKKKNGISKKEARRRRDWASDKDAATAAGLAWPSFPRSKVPGVLTVLLDKVIQKDTLRGGVFSEPVPREEFPEYYEMIKKPMDYRTMHKKLENGEYRSAQAMQKDFVLIMSNCVEFNSTNSEIVKEARQQVLERPSLLKEAALENKLFIAEDGNVIDVYSDDEEDAAQAENKIPKKRGRKPKGSPGAKKSKKPKRKLVRCKKCDPCLKEDCGDCESCLDKTKFGGTGKLKRSCVHRECENYQEVEIKARRGRPPKIKKPVDESDASDLENRNEDPDENANSDAEENGASSEPKKKTTLRLTLNRKQDAASTAPRIPKKRKKVEEEVDVNDAEIDDDLSDGEIVETPVDHRSKRRKPDAKNINGESGVYKGVGSSHMDIVTLKKEQSTFSGSLEASRSRYLDLGPWEFPEDISKEKFKQVAKMTIRDMGRHDKYSLFADAVTEDAAPGYFDIIKKPMDFGTMMHKVEDGRYSAESKGITDIYKDFLLVMDNCALYNDDNDQILGETARLLRTLPIAFAEACAKARA